ncbi:sigma-54-dependent transcriptional regulator [Vulgatibacter incomptus]|uniref:Response regulator of zinc sigma-54-dependent two-component system n=1 Tax=Vulgatibacter incomptus TaxID=1391653 RepID=A0A0K1PCQ6_9BACT|nr:sigma-54 dependent transcriptional regulator [Vulgatibacter incomptus]AKU91318.1 Response regulator of zinc sigma-54-dependent two-component system [Vulgatibacter incomptus]
MGTTEQAAALPPTDVPVVLVVDDDRANLDSVSRIFEKEGLSPRSAYSGEEALAVLQRERIDVLITDLMMPGISGADLLRACRSVSPETEVVLMTAHGTVETAVEAMKDGAYDFLTKPLKKHNLVKSVRKALEKQELVKENRRLRARVAQLSKTGGLVGNSPAFRAIMDIARQAAPSSATILLLGESGTGKELVARAIHDLSTRADAPFVPLNCAAIPESILESELFGYEKGAFTGAAGRKEGRFERAHRGTLFLDEVGEMSPSVQVKLLRAIQEGEIERLGGTQAVKVDVRLVAATNRDLAQDVKEGRFREDLYYRLNVVKIGLPPLRERHGDVPLLSDHFLRAFCEKNGKTILGFTKAAMEAMERYGWPGNVRELENAIERAVVLSRGEIVDLVDLPETVRGAMDGAAGSRAIVIPIGTPMDEIELRVIHETLRVTGGDKTLAAQLLGIATRTIYRKLDREKSAAELD